MTTPVCSCKVGTVADSWDFSGIHEALTVQWVDEDLSVRELTAKFNRRLLRAGFEEADRSPIDGEIENLYRVLTGADVDAGDRTQARERLDRDGVPIDRIESQFVSHQTIYRHLRNCLDTDYEQRTPSAEQLESWSDRIHALQARTAAVTDRGLEQLAKQGALDVGDVDVLVDITVSCPDCGGFYEIDELFDSRGCDCSPDA